MKLGWSTIDGKKYYFDKEGRRIWLETLAVKMYYFVPKTGEMNLATIYGKKYYFEKSGIRFSGIRSIGGKKYYFQKNGELLTK